MFDVHSFPFLLPIIREINAEATPSNAIAPPYLSMFVMPDSKLIISKMTSNPTTADMTTMKNAQMIAIFCINISGGSSLLAIHPVIDQGRLYYSSRLRGQSLCQPGLM
jgi:hypothetical protein